MQKEELKKTNQTETINKSFISNNRNDIYISYLKIINDNIKYLQKNHIISKEKNLKEKISLYFTQITSAINLLTNEIDSIKSKYETILIKDEQKIRTLYSDIFNLKIKNTFLENNIDILLKKEKEYKLVKEKTGIIVENGVIIYNDRKENEIFILRTENSTLKNVIIKKEKEMGEIIKKYKKEKDNYEKEILDLNQKIEKFRYKSKVYNPKYKGKSSSSIDINANDSINSNLRLNFTINNISNKANKNNNLFNGVVNNSTYNDINPINYTNRNCNKRKYKSILLNKNKNKESNILNSEKKYIKLDHCQSTWNINFKNKMINKLKKLTKEENTFHKELNLSNLNISHIQNKKIVCLTPQNNKNNKNSGINFATFQKMVDNKKKNQLKMFNKNACTIKNCLSTQNYNKSNKKNEIKVIYKKNKKNYKSNNNSNIQTKKNIKKELTVSKKLLINNSTALYSPNNISPKINKITSNKNNKEMNKINFAKSPRYIAENNKRKRNLLSNIVGNDNMISNKISLTSIKRKKTVNTSINYCKKNIFNSPKGNNA